MRLLVSLAERYSPRANEIRLDAVVLGFTLALTVTVLRFAAFSGDWRRIVGVAGDTQDGGLDAKPEPVMFMPFVQEVALGGGLAIRADSNASGLSAAATRIVRRISPTALI